MSIIINDDIKETINVGHIVQETSQGAVSTRPSKVILFQPPNSLRVCTGFGAAGFDLFMTTETKSKIKDITGHGRVREVPQSTLDTMFAVALMNNNS